MPVTNYAKDIVSLRAALLAFTLPAVEVDEEAENHDELVAAEAARQAKWAEALSHPSPVVQAVGAFDVLKADKEADIIEPAGKDLLAGASYLIMSNGWFGKGGEAAALFVELTTAS